MYTRKTAPIPNAARITFASAAAKFKPNESLSSPPAVMLENSKLLSCYII